MRALITGINGFVGTHLAEHLLDQGDDLLGCSKSGRWGEEVPPAVNHLAPQFSWDMTAPISESAHLQVKRFAPDCIYHLAAISEPSLCGGKEPTDHAVAVNIEGTRQVIELALALPTPPRLIAISSSHVYATSLSSQERVTEDHPLAPSRGYGKTKQQAEQILRRAIENERLDAIIVRAFNHTGPRQRPIAMLPEWCERLACGEDPLRVKTCDAWLDLTDVRDIVRAYRQLAAAGASGTIYNVGSGQATRSGEVLEALLALQRDSPRVEQTTPGERYEPIANISRLVEATGWRAERPLAQTVSETWRAWFEKDLSGRETKR